MKLYFSPFNPIPALKYCVAEKVFASEIVCCLSVVTTLLGVILLSIPLLLTIVELSGSTNPYLFEVRGNVYDDISK